MAVKFENYDKKREGKMQKVKKPLLIALAIVLGIILISLALTDAGFFPGNILNRFAVSSFLKDNYSSMNGEIVEFDRYDESTGYYVYKCTVNGQSCEISAKNFKVRYDGYYNSYGRNTYFEEISEKYINNFLTEKWNENYSDCTVVWESAIDIPLSDTTFPSDASNGDLTEELTLNALKTYGGSLVFTLDIHGKSISMDEYKGIAYRAVKILQQEMYNRPKSLQIFYYRENNGSEDVMQYESTIRTFQFNYNENGILNAEDLHRYVEVPEDIQKKANIYYTVRDIFLLVVSATVIVLSILWCVRKYRKHKRYNSPAPKKNSNQD